MAPFRLTGPRSARLGIALVLLGMLAPSAAQAQSRVYVTHASSGVVTTIDTTTHTPTGLIAVGAGPSRVTVSRDGSRAYVVNGTSSSVSVLDTATDQVVDTVPLSGSPSALAVTPDGQWLYVLLTTGTVEVVDAVSHATVASIPVSTAGGDIAVTPDGAKAYVASGYVSVIDIASGAVARTFLPQATTATGVANSAVGVVLSPDGTRAYVSFTSFLSDTGGFSASGGVAIVDTATDSVEATIGLGSLPGPMALSPDGSRLYVAIDATWVNTGYGAGFLPGRTISVIDAATITLAGMIDLGAAGSNWTLQNTARGLAVSGDRGHVYASVPRLNAVLVADVNTHQVVRTVGVTASPGGMGATPGNGSLVPYVVAAGDDAGTVSTAGGTAVTNVLANDRLGGLPATTGNVTLTQDSSTDAGVALDPASGAVLVDAGVPVGLHTLIYRICETASVGNCDEATVTVTVRAPYVIAAVDDAATVTPGRVAVGSVLGNDTLGGSAATLALVHLTQISVTGTGVTLNAANGSVVVAPTAPYGATTLVYRICERASPANCDEASVSVQVVPIVVNAEDDAGTTSRSGGTAVANVLANDRFGAAIATLTTVTLGLHGTAPAGLSLNTATGAVAVASGTASGSYALTYRICERARPDNCDVAGVSITVTGYAISAVNDTARGSSKVANTPLASVLTNDRLGGLPVTTATVQLSLVSLSPANNKVRLDLTDGSVDVLGKTSSGTYQLVYRLCERASLANCAQATVTLELSGKGN